MENIFIGRLKIIALSVLVASVFAVSVSAAEPTYNPPGNAVSPTFNSVTVQNNANLERLTVDDSASFNGPVSIVGNALRILGANGTLFGQITGSAVGGNGLNFSGLVRFLNNVTVNTNLNVGGTLGVTGVTSLGNANVTGNLGVNGNLNLGTDITVTHGNNAIGKFMKINGAFGSLFQFVGNVAGPRLDLLPDAIVSTGNLALTSANIAGSVKIGAGNDDTLVVRDNDVTVNGNSVMNGNLSVTGSISTTGATPLNINDNFVINSATDLSADGVSAFKIVSGEGTWLGIDRNEIAVYGDGANLFLNHDSGNDVVVGKSNVKSDLKVNGNLTADDIGNFLVQESGDYIAMPNNGKNRVNGVVCPVDYKVISCGYSLYSDNAGTSYRGPGISVLGLVPRMDEQACAGSFWNTSGSQKYIKLSAMCFNPEVSN